MLSSAVIKDYVAPEWAQVLSGHGLTDFESLWNMQLEPLDAPNTERGGWSSVSCLSLHLPGAEVKRLIVKRQRNHTSRTFLHPLRGVPTFAKELANIFHFEALKIPTVTPVYYAQRLDVGNVRAVLITEFLEGYLSLEELTNSWLTEGGGNRTERNRVIKAVSSLLSELHRKKVQHNSLYPKHLFIRDVDNDIQVRLIDLEKSKWRPLGNWRRIRDLESLHRRTKGWSHTDRLRFLNTYCGSERLGKKERRLCRQVLKRTERRVKG